MTSSYPSNRPAKIEVPALLSLMLAACSIEQSTGLPKEILISLESLSLGELSVQILLDLDRSHDQGWRP